MKNALNSDNSEDYSSNEDDKLSCRGSRHSDTPPFSSSSDAETEEEFQGKSMPPDFVPTMDTRSATKLPVSSGVAASSSMFGIPAVNPLGGTLGSVPNFLGDRKHSSHKKRKSSKKSKKQHKKSKHAKKSADAYAISVPKVSVVKAAALSSSSSQSSSSDDDTSRNPQQVLFLIFFLSVSFYLFIIYHVPLR